MQMRAFLKLWVAASIGFFLGIGLFVYLLEDHPRALLGRAISILDENSRSGDVHGISLMESAEKTAFLRSVLVASSITKSLFVIQSVVVGVGLSAVAACTLLWLRRGSGPPDRGNK